MSNMREIHEEIEKQIQEAVFEKAEMEKHARMVIGEHGQNSGMSIVDRGVKIAKIEGKIQAMVDINAGIRRRIEQEMMA